MILWGEALCIVCQILNRITYKDLDKILYAFWKNRKSKLKVNQRVFRHPRTASIFRHPRTEFLELNFLLWEAMVCPIESGQHLYLYLEASVSTWHSWKLWQGKLWGLYSWPSLVYEKPAQRLKTIEAPDLQQICQKDKTGLMVDGFYIIASEAKKASEICNVWDGPLFIAILSTVRFYPFMRNHMAKIFNGRVTKNTLTIVGKQSMFKEACEFYFQMFEMLV